MNYNPYDGDMVLSSPPFILLGNNSEIMADVEF
jgi:hypothetical protein